jgi:hypothetical protein
MREIIYDSVLQQFFCYDHISKEEFMMEIWEQFDTDFCVPDFDSGDIAYRWRIDHENDFVVVDKETAVGVPITTISGWVVGLGPQRCGLCEHLMRLLSREIRNGKMVEQWQCTKCRTEQNVVLPL